VDNKALCAFTRQLAILHDAGVSLVESLKLLKSEMPSGVLKNALIDICFDVESSGTSLSDALQKHPSCFSGAYVSMVRAGETSGVLELTLERLAAQLEKSRSLRKKVKSAMIYPAVVITVAVAIVTFIMIGIIPKFATIFRDMGMTLPSLTQSLISTSRWFATYWYTLPLFPLAGWGLIKILRNTRSGNYALDRLILWIPVIGPLAAKAEIARSMRMLATLVGTHVSILEALLLVRDACTNMVFARMYQWVYETTRNGGTMHDAMKESRVLPAMVVTMVKVADEAGKQEQTLNKVADVYEEEVDEAVKGMMSILEPLMTVLLGVLVGVIVIALFLPLVKLLEGMSK